MSRVNPNALFGQNLDRCCVTENDLTERKSRRATMPRAAFWKSSLSGLLLLSGLATVGLPSASSIAMAQDQPLTTNPPAAELKPTDEFEKQVLTEKFYAEGAAVADFNGDHHNDVVYGPYWYEGPKFEKAHLVYPATEFPRDNYSKNFVTFARDIDEDGDADVIRVGFPGEETAWYENPGSEGKDDQPWPMHLIFDVTDNESPTLVDVVGDERPELVFQTDGYFGFAKMNSDDPKAKWTFHKVSEQIAGGRFTHGIGAGDVDGDGRQDILTSGGWLQQPEDWKQSPWKFHKIQFCPAASHMYTYDFDGDGKNDILTAIHAHQWGVVWYRQVTTETGDVDFQPQWIVGRTPEDTDHHVVFTQPHAIELVDMNGDGIKDVITGRRHWAHNGHDPGGNDPAVLYWFETQRKADSVQFVPHLIDKDSGVGTQVTVTDINGDHHPDILVGNKKGAAVFLQKNEDLEK